MSAPDSPPAAVPSRILPRFAFVVSALAVGFLLVRDLRHRSELDALRTERDLAQTAYQMISNQLAERTLLAEHLITDFGRRLQRQEDLTRLKVSRLTAATAAFEKTHAVIVWDPENNAGLLVAENLPPPADGTAYQISLLDSGNGSHSAGDAFAPDADGRVLFSFKAETPGSSIEGFALSVGSTSGSIESATVLLRDN